MSAPAAAGLVDPADRGHLDVQPIVLRRIVEYAADQVPGTLRHERRLAGIDVGEAGASARVSVGSGDPLAVDVRLELTLRYPARVRAVVEAVRAKVGEELTRIAGFHVRTMTVTVAGLRESPTPGASPRIPL
ncbi:Asp23/Gls24 family envelope stress response protein [Pseudonocardia humida]|uniref:Asp23/Gls24 family envelope stress response protein n=1 Tax=Pseudonocardia humida TaxID=2800819 RepID=A0ABT1ADV3_9PSEU|nr:Asp23/Gls24 family envelope stress response protein [Pseudonocardia humida]MCO1660944.1 Asp23/Gls24 family envelope stress response protein [Pseudonocardia humida]